MKTEGRQKEKLRGGKENLTEIKKGETKLMERILQRNSLHKPMVTTLQTGSRESMTKKYNNYPNKPDASDTKNTKETMEVLLDYLFEEENTEENQYQNR